ncbi:uncharacterized protein ACOB8E_014021 isoform 1-T1 [Sarcophilus harrisii]
MVSVSQQMQVAAFGDAPLRIEEDRQIYAPPNTTPPGPDCYNPVAWGCSHQGLRPVSSTRFPSLTLDTEATGPRRRDREIVIANFWDTTLILRREGAICIYYITFGLPSQPDGDGETETQKREAICPRLFNDFMVKKTSGAPDLQGI